MIDEKRLLEVLEKNFYGIGGVEVLKQIINEQPKVGEWIPIEEELPREKKFYEEITRSPLCLVTALSDDELMVHIDRTVNGVWTLEETFDKSKIIAWRPLPEPYSSGD